MPPTQTTEEPFNPEQKWMKCGVITMISPTNYGYQDALDGLRDVTLCAFLTYSDSIKGDQELIEAYEGLLQLLVGLNDPQSAVLLDEFRLH